MPDLSIVNMRMCADLESGLWIVGKYEVSLYAQGWYCTCPSFKFGKGKNCKHINSVQKERQCGWHQQYSAERLEGDSEKCPRCDGETVVVRVGI